jgi:hypothetical protein
MQRGPIPVNSNTSDGTHAFLNLPPSNVTVPNLHANNTPNTGRTTLSSQTHLTSRQVKQQWPSQAAKSFTSRTEQHNHLYKELHNHSTLLPTQKRNSIKHTEHFPLDTMQVDVQKQQMSETCRRYKTDTQLQPFKNRPYCEMRGSLGLHNPEDEETTTLRNVGDYMPHDTATCPIRSAQYAHSDNISASYSIITGRGY